MLFTLDAESLVNFVGFQLAVKACLRQLGDYVSDSHEPAERSRIPDRHMDIAGHRVEDCGTRDDGEAGHDEQGGDSSCNVFGYVLVEHDDSYQVLMM